MAQHRGRGNGSTLAPGTLGYEWDEDVDNDFRPEGLIRLSDTTMSGVDRLQDFLQSGRRRSLFRFGPPSGLLVTQERAHWVRNVLAKLTLLRNVNSAEISRQCSVLT